MIAGDRHNDFIPGKVSPGGPDMVEVFGDGEPSEVSRQHLRHQSSKNIREEQFRDNLARIYITELEKKRYSKQTIIILTTQLQSFLLSKHHTQLMQAQIPSEETVTKLLIQRMKVSQGNLKANLQGLRKVQQTQQSIFVSESDKKGTFKLIIKQQANQVLVQESKSVSVVPLKDSPGSKTSTALVALGSPPTLVASQVAAVEVVNSLDQQIGVHVYDKAEQDKKIGWMKRRRQATRLRLQQLATQPQLPGVQAMMFAWGSIVRPSADSKQHSQVYPDDLVHNLKQVIHRFAMNPQTRMRINENLKLPLEPFLRIQQKYGIVDAQYQALVQLNDYDPTQLTNDQLYVLLRVIPSLGLQDALSFVQTQNQVEKYLMAEKYFQSRLISGLAHPRVAYEGVDIKQRKQSAKWDQAQGLAIAKLITDQVGALTQRSLDSYSNTVKGFLQSQLQRIRQQQSNQAKSINTQQTNMVKEAKLSVIQQNKITLNRMQQNQITTESKIKQLEGVFSSKMTQALEKISGYGQSNQRAMKGIGAQITGVREQVNVMGAQVAETEQLISSQLEVLQDNIQKSVFAAGQELSNQNKAFTRKMDEHAAHQFQYSRALNNSIYEQSNYLDETIRQQAIGIHNNMNLSFEEQARIADEKQKKASRQRAFLGQKIDGQGDRISGELASHSERVNKQGQRIVTQNTQTHSRLDSQKIALTNVTAIVQRTAEQQAKSMQGSKDLLASFPDLLRDWLPPAGIQALVKNMAADNNQARGPILSAFLSFALIDTYGLKSLRQIQKKIDQVLKGTDTKQKTLKGRMILEQDQEQGDGQWGVPAKKKTIITEKTMLAQHKAQNTSLEQMKKIVQQMQKLKGEGGRSARQQASMNKQSAKQLSKVKGEIAEVIRAYKKNNEEADARFGKLVTQNTEMMAEGTKNNKQTVLTAQQLKDAFLQGESNLKKREHQRQLSQIRKGQVFQAKMLDILQNSDLLQSRDVSPEMRVLQRQFTQVAKVMVQQRNAAEAQRKVYQQQLFFSQQQIQKEQRVAMQRTNQYELERGRQSQMYRQVLTDVKTQGEVMAAHLNETSLETKYKYQEIAKLSTQTHQLIENLRGGNLTQDKLIAALQGFLKTWKQPHGARQLSSTGDMRHTMQQQRNLVGIISDSLSHKQAQFQSFLRQLRKDQEQEIRNSYNQQQQIRQQEKQDLKNTMLGILRQQGVGVGGNQNDILSSLKESYNTQMQFMKAQFQARLNQMQNKGALLEAARQQLSQTSSINMNLVEFQKKKVAELQARVHQVQIALALQKQQVLNQKQKLAFVRVQIDQNKAAQKSGGQPIFTDLIESNKKLVQQMAQLKSQSDQEIEARLSFRPESGQQTSKQQYLALKSQLASQRIRNQQLKDQAIKSGKKAQQLLVDYRLRNAKLEERITRVVDQVAYEKQLHNERVAELLQKTDRAQLRTVQSSQGVTDTQQFTRFMLQLQKQAKQQHKYRSQGTRLLYEKQLKQMLAEPSLSRPRRKRDGDKEEEIKKSKLDEYIDEKDRFTIQSLTNFYKELSTSDNLDNAQRLIKVMIIADFEKNRMVLDPQARQIMKQRLRQAKVDPYIAPQSKKYDSLEQLQAINKPFVKQVMGFLYDNAHTQAQNAVQKAEYLDI